MNELNRLLGHPTKKAEQATGVLAKMYRQLLLELNIQDTRMNILLNHWLNDPRNGIPNDGKSRSSERGNFVKEIARDDMSWKVFLKGLRLLGPKRVRIEVHCWWWDNKKTTTGINIAINDISLEKEDDEPV